MYFYIYICQYAYFVMCYFHQSYYFFAYVKKLKIKFIKRGCYLVEERFSKNSSILQVFLLKLPDKKKVLKIF